MVDIPTIDFASYDESKTETISLLAQSVSEALSSSGFMKIRNLGVSDQDIRKAFDLSAWFFARTDEEKATSAYTSAAENFGYQGLGVEHLDPSKPADLKQTFTMRDLLRHDPNDSRWPSEDFRDIATDFYQKCLEGAYRIQRVFSEALSQEKEFFVQYHSGENVSLRFLYYPAAGVTEIEHEQLGAGAHTDYGMITLLFQQGVAGLEVQDSEGHWHEVEPESDAIVMNTGDLMERWTNGRYRSTPHRVQPTIGAEDRYSIALFVDPDTETPVKVLDSCLSPGESPRYPEVTAGEHIQERIRASHG
ncbi:MAG: isopenicillin N synthase family oxygenase [Pseudomonadales bacterium]|nr:isopenicillin N synthase family oxygenase [Pseudomonadales bacterium]MBO6657129.1 isopenicillin N synthase family oxygenase [Pseudomonadales bacterium]MBO6701606.1 isopenicillin N synthase family oxygenase [Pseudomonadales bacterium]MBO7007437.1 isopenicillin N synthase family oxygenase [Pseudomonadales bacterium]